MDDRTAMLREVRANPGDVTTRLAFSDWLRERDEFAAADAVRDGAVTVTELEQYRSLQMEGGEMFLIRTFEVRGPFRGELKDWLMPAYAAGLPMPGEVDRVHGFPMEEMDFERADWDRALVFIKYGAA